MSAEPYGWGDALELDATEAHHVGRRTLQWAQAVERDAPDSERKALQAGALYRLAVGFLLLGGDDGRAACAQAAGYLRLVGDSYAAVLSVCAGDRDGVRWAIEVAPDDALTPTQRAHVMTALAWAAVTGDPDMRERYWATSAAVESVAPSPAGRLRLPLAVTAAVLDAAVAQDAERLGRAVDDLLSRTDEVFGAAMLDRYHWQHMVSRVMPVEPEIVAPLAVAVVAGAPTSVERRAPARVSLSIAAWLAASAR
jgi:hypothetical protein